MKKVIFISALAIAAAVSCTKSDIVDTKFNEQIGFEAYLGRDAQTKATVATTFEKAGIYGFYTGLDKWKIGTETTGVENPKANLWTNADTDFLNSDGTVSPVKYWTNDSDWYSFLAYAPKTNANVTPSDESGANPKVTYKVDTDLSKQVDLISARVINTQRPKTAEGAYTKVPMTFEHALARLTVKAHVTAATPFEYHIKEVSINGGFIAEDVLTLATGKWDSNGVSTATASEDGKYPTTYTLYTRTVDAENSADFKLPVVAENVTAQDYAYYAKNQEGVYVNGDATNYIMMIPVNFTEKKATLTVKYTTYHRDGDLESAVYTKTFDVTNNFEAGKAYAIDLKFIQAENPEITFTVKVDEWKVQADTTIDPAN